MEHGAGGGEWRGGTRSPRIQAALGVRAGLVEPEPQRAFYAEANMLRLPPRPFWDHHRRAGKDKMDQHTRPEEGEKEKAELRGQRPHGGAQMRTVKGVNFPFEWSSKSNKTHLKVSHFLPFLPIPEHFKTSS